IVKRGAGNEVWVSVTDLLTAEPVAGVELELLDYQQQVMEQGKSDAAGMARFETERKPFLLIARKGEQRGYLRLDDCSRLPLSRLDVGGGEVQQGLKGFIFGERGVWRPGDSVYLSFILEDKSGRLPDDHPVTFEVINPRGQLYLRQVKTGSADEFITFLFVSGADESTGNRTAWATVWGRQLSTHLISEICTPDE